VAPLDLPVLTDGIVRLRPFTEDDAPALAAIWRDPSIRARNTIPEPDEEAARGWVAMSAARASSGQAWEWAIVDAVTGELAGRRALKGIDRRRRQTEAAVWIAPEWRGRRFASRSLRLAAAHAFAHGLLRVYAVCDTDNDASFRSLLAAGAQHEGTLRANFMLPSGEVVDQHVFGLLHADLAGPT
jgi:RimJ/RimL family protein N-acetyltransferase